MPASDALRAVFNGAVIEPGSPQYDTARELFNSRHDHRPAIIARCTGTADVVEAIRFARSHGLEIAVRSGGRHMAGFASADGGLVVDLSGMRAVKVDPQARTAWVQCGALGIDLQAEAARYGLAGVTGVLTHTGIGGVTLHGGLGWLSPKLGWGADTVVEAELVSAEGEVLRIAADENADLFWAIRGNGSNFGVVTWMQMRLHPIPRQVQAGPLLYRLDRGPEVLRFLRDFTRSSSDEWLCFVEFLFGNDDAALPQALRGRLLVMVNLVHFGDAGLAEGELGALREALPPDVDGVGSRELVEYTRRISGTYPRMRQWWDQEQVGELSDEAIELTMRRARAMDEAGLSRLSCLMLYPMRGALAAEPEHGNSVPRSRPDSWCVDSMLFWDDPEDDARHQAWSDGTMAQFRGAGLTTGVVCGNVQQAPDEDRRRRSIDADAWQRLRDIKAARDPGNVFHRNHNIPPSP